MAKSKYLTHIKPRFKEIKKWKEDGLNNNQIIENLGISKNFFYESKNNNNDFDDFLKECNENQITQIENAMFNNAIGYQTTETTKSYIDADGKQVIEKTKYNLPNAASGIFLLKNLASDKYQDRQIQELTTTDNKPIIWNDLPKKRQKK